MRNLSINMDNYSKLVERISTASSLTKEEIERKVEAKRAKLSGLVSKEGAAQIVAAELGINFDKEKMKLSELVQGMKRVNTLGKVIDISPVRSYSKNGREGKVVNLTIADATANVKTVLWDTNHISLIEQEKLKKDDVIEISNAQIRNGELHLGSFSDIKVIKEKLDNVMSSKSTPLKKLKEVKVGQGMKTRAIIVQIFDPRYFEVCPECGKRVLENECKTHGSVQPKKRALLNIVIDDGSDSIRSVLFGENIYNLGLTEEEVFDLEKFMHKKIDILGEEMFFSGMIKSNNLYNTTEFNIESIEKVNASDLLKELEAKKQ